MSKTRRTGIGDLKNDDGKELIGTFVGDDTEAALAHRKVRPHIVVLNVLLGVASILALIVCAFVAFQLLRS